MIDNTQILPSQTGVQGQPLEHKMKTQHPSRNTQGKSDKFDGLATTSEHHPGCFKELQIMENKPIPINCFFPDFFQQYHSLKV